MPNIYGNTLIGQTNSRWYDEGDEELYKKVVADALADRAMLRHLTPHGVECRPSARGMWDGSLSFTAADNSPPLITFTTAWGPPCGEVRAAVRRWLEMRGIGVHVWIGSDPYDSSTTILENWTGR